MKLFEQLRDFFAARDVQAYLVGGYLRDALLGRPSHDVDVALEGDAADAARVLAQNLGGTAVPLDPSRGIFRVVLPQGSVDLATAPDGVQADLARRDFTIDAMAVPFSATAGAPDTWPLVDPFGGRADLRSSLVRVVSPQAFRDDPLRLLRAIRLAAQLRFDIEPTTLVLLKQDAGLVNQVAAERLRDELLGILAQPDLERSLALLANSRLLDLLIPELTPARGVTQPFEHYWDVYDHSLQCAVMVERVLDPEYRRSQLAGQAIPWEPWLEEHFSLEASDGHTRATLLKLAALLHDVSKPETKTVEPSGRARFLGHPTLGAEKAEGIARRLRLSGHGVGMLRTLVEQHLRPSHLAQRDEMPTPRAIYRYFRDLGDLAVDLLYLNMADYLAARGPDLELEPWRFHCRRLAQTLERTTALAEPQGPPRLVDGHDLVKLFGLQPGPDFRPLLEAVREAQATGEVNSREEAMALLERTLGRPPREPASSAAIRTGHA